MTARPDNAALIAWATRLSDDEGDSRLGVLAAALAAAEERIEELSAELREDYRWQKLWEEENDRAKAAEERAQAAERERRRLRELADLRTDAWQVAEAQVRELREALARIADPQSELAGGRVRAGAKTPTEIARAVLARSARRAET